MANSENRAEPPLEGGSSNSSAILSAIAAYGIWGLLPVYWKCFDQVPAYEVLVHRIVWSFVFMAALIPVFGRWEMLKREAACIWKNRKKRLCLAAGSILISFNWLTYIWAINHDRVVESSLGYFINPLLNVLAGVLVLRERLSLWQFLAVIWAAIGVVYLTVNYGSFPFVALFLATSITFYSLCKKTVGLSAVSGMFLETALIAPIALVILAVLYHDGKAYPIGLTSTFLLLAGTGVVTAVPLLLNAHSLNKLPLSVLGVLQYLSPSLTLMLGVFLYGEDFSRSHLIAFSFIWSALVLFSIARTGFMKNLERRLSGRLGRTFSR